MAKEKRLIDAIEQEMPYCPDTDYEIGYQNGLTMAKAIAIKMDVVEVVRCKDCKHYKPQNQGAHRNCTTPYCMRVCAVKVSPDDFCSYGERRTEDE